MDYTAEQYDVMNLLQAGLIYDDQAPNVQDLIRYLQNQGIATPKAYIAEGYYELSEDGKRVLENHRKQESIRQDNIQKEQAQEQKELEKIIRERADRAADRTAEHRFQTRLSIWNTVFGAVLGALFSNLDRLIPLIINLIKKFFA